LDVGKKYFLCIVVEGNCPGHRKAMNNNSTIIDLTVKLCWGLRMLRADALKEVGLGSWQAEFAKFRQRGWVRLYFMTKELLKVGISALHGDV